uniref:Uncharacterized protein n=1 Tax=Arundo donax TaxID=35708 RepID=A0A0A9SIM6_ARUDO
MVEPPGRPRAGEAGGGGSPRRTRGARVSARGWSAGW